jgi:hypothetical protein
LNPDKDRYKESEDTYYPANHTLIASIAEVRFARIRSFWTDEPSLFPDDPETGLVGALAQEGAKQRSSPDWQTVSRKA